MSKRSQPSFTAPFVLEPLAVPTKEAARLLSVSPSEIRKLARHGLLSYRKLSKTNWMFSMKALRQFAEGGCQVSPAVPEIPNISHDTFDVRRGVPDPGKFIYLGAVA